MKGKETRSDLQVAVTKNDQKVCGKWTLKNKSFVHGLRTKFKINLIVQLMHLK